MTARAGLALLATVFMLWACAEKSQTAAATRNSDGKPWEATQSAYMAEGWKASDQASWEQQMRLRAQSQNEYSRIAAKPQ